MAGGRSSAPLEPCKCKQPEATGSVKGRGRGHEQPSCGERLVTAHGLQYVESHRSVSIPLSSLTDAYAPLQSGDGFAIRSCQPKRPFRGWLSTLPSLGELLVQNRYRVKENVR